VTYSLRKTELGHTNTVKMKIDTGNHRPIKNRPNRPPLNKTQVINLAIDEMLEAKVMERSQSPWSFSLIAVDKKDGSKIMCVDFRSLNKVVTPISLPLPLIDFILALLGKSKYFTRVDIGRSNYMTKSNQRRRLFVIGDCFNSIGCHLA